MIFSLILPKNHLEVIQQHTVDFLGSNLINTIQSVCGHLIISGMLKHRFNPERFYENFDLPGKQMNRSRGWEIYPKVMYDMANYLKEITATFLG